MWLLCVYSSTSYSAFLLPPAIKTFYDARKWKRNAGIIYVIYSDKNNFYIEKCKWWKLWLNGLTRVWGLAVIISRSGFSVQVLEKIWKGWLQERCHDTSQVLSSMVTDLHMLGGSVWGNLISPIALLQWLFQTTWANMHVKLHTFRVEQPRA